AQSLSSLLVFGKVYGTLPSLSLLSWCLVRCVVLCPVSLFSPGVWYVLYLAYATLPLVCISDSPIFQHSESSMKMFMSLSLEDKEVWKPFSKAISSSRTSPSSKSVECISFTQFSRRIEVTWRPVSTFLILLCGGKRELCSSVNEVSTEGDFYEQCLTVVIKCPEKCYMSDIDENSFYEYLKNYYCYQAKDKNNEYILINTMF
ncbi:hypothetical protein STEG23_020645, partial [Scotinomys teguina]